MKPLLKWAGGKRHIANILQDLLPSDWNQGAYIEPFVGGAALFLHLEPQNARIADVNKWLIRFYRDVKSQPNELLDEISKISVEFNTATLDEKKGLYLQTRSQFNLSEPSLLSSARFYALNKLCFNGLYRENARGEFNVPFGQKKVFPEVSVDDFLEVSKVLATTEIELSDFGDTAAHAEPGDFVYFDPPYVPLTPTSSFTSYSSGGFGLESQRKLAETVRELGNKGVRAMVSNSATNLTSEIFDGLRQVTISAPRMVSANSSGRGNVDELVIMNY